MRRVHEINVGIALRALSNIFCRAHCRQVWYSSKVSIFLDLLMKNFPPLHHSESVFVLRLHIRIDYHFFVAIRKFLRHFLLIWHVILASYRPVNYSPSHHIDCIIVACLRRVQEWSFVSILGELRMHSACRQFDVEQFIEEFDPDTIDISTNTPDFLKIHIRLKVR